MISELAAKARVSEYARSVRLLATGTLFAQLIGLAASPILTRLYSPADFAVLAIFGAIVSSISAAACGRYDIAVIVAKEETDANLLLSLSFWVAALVSLLMFSAIFLAEDSFRLLLKAESLGYWLLAAPLALFLGSVGAALKCYANRCKDYRAISRISVYVAIISLVLSTIFGLMKFGEQGLLYANLSTTVVTLLFFLRKYRKEIVKLKCAAFSNLLEIAMRYKHFPILNGSTTLLNSISLALPVFFLTKYYPPEIVGFYAILTRVAMAPLGFISDAVSQVNIRKVAEKVHKNQDASDYITKLTWVLTAIVLPPTLILMVSAPEIFAVFFGESWREAGNYLVILMPALALKFVVSTLSPVFSATNNNGLGAFWRISIFITTMMMFSFAAGRVNIQELFLLMLITDIIMYSLCYLLIRHAVRHPKKII